MQMYKNPQDKIDFIIGQLINYFPFYGRAALYLNWTVREDLNPPTAATDGRSVFWHPDFLMKCDDRELIYVAVHEIHHVIKKHNLIRKGRDLKRFNIACDHAINLELDNYLMQNSSASSKMKAPADIYHDPKYTGWLEEDIYEDLEDNIEFMAGCATGMFDMAGDISEAEEAEEHRRIDRIVEASAKAARDAGKLPGHLEEWIMKNKAPKINWKQKLRRFFAPIYPREYSWSRLNKRAIARQIYMPGIVKDGVGPLTVIIDTSGSVSDRELEVFINELNYLISEVNPEWTQVIYFESYPWLIERYQAGEQITIPKQIKRGGTNFEKAFEAIQGDPKAVICLTDMGDSFSFKPPSCPTMWVATTKITAPWGETIQIEV